MTNPPNATAAPSYFSAALLLALSIIPINVGVYWATLNSRLESGLLLVFTVLCLVQLVAGVVAFVQGIRLVGRSNREGHSSGPAVLRIVLGIFTALAAVGGWVGGALLVVVGSGGGGWGRPLRVKGRQLHPELKEGADWTAGERPSRAGLDAATCAALEGLWLHDAQKEHASVPAFSRISWLLAAVGAPADLMAWSHKAALEEVDHAQRCFALAAGYGGRTFTVEPMTDLLLGGLADVKDPVVTLALESLKDGCLLEDFNADIAAKCATVCEEPVTRSVLLQIAREERSHADFSWALIDWALAHHRVRVAPALEQALTELEQISRPTTANAEKQKRVDRADPKALRRHGRIEDAEWAECWAQRVSATRARMLDVLNPTLRRAA
jgi:hypothetical protein